VSLTILYHNPRRPGEAGLTFVADEPNAAAMKELLEYRGFAVSKIETAPVTKTGPTPAAQSQRWGQ
jgi:hypothetical protein